MNKHTESGFCPPFHSFSFFSFGFIPNLFLRITELANEGNQYGKNKGDLKGKEFGQARAAEAKSKLQEKEKSLENKEELISQSNKRLAAAKERLEKAKAEGTLTEEQIKEKEAIIDKVEGRTKRLKESLEEANKKKSLMKCMMTINFLGGNYHKRI